MNIRFGTFFCLWTFAAIFLFGTTSAGAATFVWLNTNGVWSDPAKWSGTAPSGTDSTDILVFGGDVNPPLRYASTNDLAAMPSLLNRLVFNASNMDNSGEAHEIRGGAIALGGIAPQIAQNNLGGFLVDIPIELRAPLTLTGNGGIVTINQAISGAFDITKNGSSTFRFGTFTDGGASTWFGGLTINAGAILLNTSPQAARAALRGNPVTLTSATSILASNQEMRMGTLRGDLGLVESKVSGPPGANLDNENIVIHALSDGTYGGTLRLAPPTGTGRDTGKLIVRGVGTQTLTGGFVSPDSPAGANALQIQKDIVVGRSATLALAGNASLSQQTAAGAIVMSGGTFQLDNSATNNPNRLRDGDSGSTGIDSAGGGVFELIGAFGGTTEIMSRLQLGSPSNARSGALTIRVIQPAATVVPTQLMLQSLSRDGFAPTFSTVDFTATDPLGTEFPLGEPGFARISFIAPAVLANGLLRNTRNINPATVGWATVNGSAFATHGANGIAPVELDPTPAGDTAGDPTANIEIRGSFAVTNSGGYAANSIRFEPTADGQSFAINTSGNLQTHGILLAGTRDFTISGNMGGGFAGSAAGAIAAAGRYVHVESATLTISAPLNTGFVTLVKAGQGTLVLTNPGNINSFSTTVINDGILRATALTSLPAGELRFRGGILEITGGGTFSRAIGQGPGAVNWAAIDEFGSAVDEDEGSGGFAAVGADVNIDLGTAGPTLITWENESFINSGHALIFGSRTADRSVSWLDHLHLGGSANYNAREIRVTDNPASSTDLARFRGTIVGTPQNDLLKTGDGTLELVASNSYAGATLIHEGTLLVNAPGTIGSSFLTEVRDGATLGGNGTVGPVKVAPGGDLAPGSSVTNTGILSTGSINFDGPGAQFSIEIGGSAPGTGFDQLAVTGTVALNGANLAGSLVNGFLPEIDQLFFLIVNDGTEPVSGTFAQGTTVTFSGTPFQIGYAGNSQTNSFSGGNDVVARAVPEPAAALVAGAGMMLLLSQTRRRHESAS